MLKKQKEIIKIEFSEEALAHDRSMTKKNFIILMVLVVLLALFARSWNINTLPPGVYPDEAVNGVDAISANLTQHWQVFYENNNGREGLFMNLIALGFSLFGISVASLKMWSILFGTLTALGMVLLGDELFQSRRAGIIAGFLTATSFWAINFSRISFRANMLPFVLVWTVFFLIRGIQKKKLVDYVMAGIFFGLGAHTYIAFRIAPLILIVLLLAFMASRRKFFRTHWKEILAFSLAMFIAALPMIVDFYFHPEHFSGRSSQVSVFNPEINKGHLFLTLGKTFGLSLAKYNFFGDQNWRHNLPPWPELFPAIGIFFLFGLGYFIYEFFYLLWRRVKAGQRSDRLILVSLLLAWFFVMLLPEAISEEGLPHALRSIGTLPAALLLATFALESAFKWAGKGKFKKHKKTIAALLVIIIIGSGAYTLKQYFFDWGGSKEIHGAFNENYMNIAEYLNSLPQNMPKYVIDNGPGIEMQDGLQTSAEVVKLFTFGKAENLKYLEPGFDPLAIKKPSRVVLMSFDQGIIDRILAAHPGSIVETLDYREGYSTDFTAVNVK